MWLLVAGFIFYFWDDIRSTFSFLSTSIKYSLWPDLEVPLKERYGSWALVTGCTEGIGKAYAVELAKRGISIVMASIYQHELDAVAEEIETKYNVKTKKICVDLTGGKEAIDKVRRELGDIPVGILVNNVGCAPAYPDLLSRMPERVVWNQLDLNVCALTMMTHMILPQMVERRKGAIVNIASQARLLTLPLLNVYSASKAYVHIFSKGLQMEYARYNIDVHRVNPFFVKTVMTRNVKHCVHTEAFMPEAESFVSEAIKALGRHDHTAGYWPHRITRKEYVKYAKVFPLSDLLSFKVPSKWYRRTVGTLEIVFGAAMAFIPHHKVKNGSNVGLLLLTLMAVYSHYMVNDKLERTAPALVFLFMLSGRLVVYWQLTKKSTEQQETQVNGFKQE